MNPCDVAHATFHVAKTGPKFKFLIVVDTKRNLGLLINSKPFTPPAAHVRVTPTELPFLDHDSFVDTAQLVCIHDLDEQIATGKGKIVGHVDEPLRQRIYTAITTLGLLPTVQQRLIADAFGLALPA